MPRSATREHSPACIHMRSTTNRSLPTWPRSGRCANEFPASTSPMARKTRLAQPLTNSQESNCRCLHPRWAHRKSKRNRSIPGRGLMLVQLVLEPPLAHPLGARLREANRHRGSAQSKLEHDTTETLFVRPSTQSATHQPNILHSVWTSCFMCFVL